MDFLTMVIVFLLLIVGLGQFNEKVTKFTYEISLMLFSVIISIVLLILNVVLKDGTVVDFIEKLQMINLEKFLMEGVLCFMLFAGSCHMKLLDFKKHARPVSVLAIIVTLLGAVFYGGLFYVASMILGLPFDIPTCLMFGSIVAPTDPIAATSILKKFNLPENVGFTIEGESLLNDGVGVALFVCFSSMVTAQEGGGFVQVLVTELFGAIIVGLIVTAICFPIFSSTSDSKRQIFVSLLAVAVAYKTCEHFGFSGAIASVTCGVLFSALRNYQEMKGRVWELHEFDTFWEILDNLLNSILYIMLGLTFVSILQMEHVLIISAVAIVLNLIGRGGSLFVGTFFMGTLPDGYDRVNFVKLLTWGGLRGGLSIALAMSTIDMVSSETYYILLGATYAIVAFTTIIQGMTMQKVYKNIEASVNANGK